MAGFGHNMWFVLAFLLQTAMILTIVPALFATTTKSLTSLLRIGLFVPQVGSCIWIGILLATSWKEKFYGNNSSLNRGRLFHGGTVITSFSLFVVVAIALLVCANGATGYCTSPTLFIDAFLVAWLLVNSIVQVTIMSIFRFWALYIEPTTEVSAQTVDRTILRERTILLLVDSALLFAWLCYMVPMFFSLMTYPEFFFTIPISGTVIVLALLIVGVRVSLGMVGLLVWVPILFQVTLLITRLVYIGQCRRGISASCFYSLPQVDIVMIFANIVILVILGGALFAITKLNNKHTKSE
jgi:hypothetical protein